MKMNKDHYTDQFKSENINSEQLYKALFENSNDAIFLLNTRGEHLKVNRKATEILGYTDDEIRDMSYRELIMANEIDDSETTLKALLQGRIPGPYEKTMVKKDGSSIPVEINLSLIRDRNGKPLIVQSVVRDISARKTTQRELKKLSLFKNSVFEIISETISHSKKAPPWEKLLDVTMKVIESACHGWIFQIFNDRLIPIFETGEFRRGLKKAELERLEEKKDGFDDAGIYKGSGLFSGLELGEEHPEVHYLLIPIDLKGNLNVVFLLKDCGRVSPFNQNDVETSTFLKNNVEVMLQKIDLENRLLTKQKQLATLANYDSLTDLYNRRRFTEVCYSKLLTKKEYAFLYIDLNKFKEINDTLGHFRGDELLKKLASRLKELCPDSGVVGRLGGDEFGFLIRENKRDRIVDFAGEIIDEIEAYYDIPGWYGRVRASIGIAKYPGDASTFNELLKNADIAMYEAKFNKLPYVFFERAFSDEIKRKIKMEKEIEESLKNDGFLLYYQPIVNTFDQSVKGYEALVRWDHPEKGILSPGRFLPFAEKTGLVGKIDKRVREMVAARIKTWQDAGVNLSLSMNVSANDFLEPDFLKKMDYLIKKHAIDPAQLIIELTENSFFDDLKDCLHKIHYLKKKKIRFSIDDFGTGYSSLSYLSKIPVDYLKIDREFVRDIHQNYKNSVIVKSTIEIAHNFGFEVIAEGVENGAEHRVLKDLGSDYLQGYFFGKPGRL